MELTLHPFIQNILNSASNSADKENTATRKTTTTKKTDEHIIHNNDNTSFLKVSFCVMFWSLLILEKPNLIYRCLSRIEFPIGVAVCQVMSTSCH